MHKKIKKEKPMNLKELKKEKRNYYMKERSNISSEIAKIIYKNTKDFLYKKISNQKSAQHIGIYWPMVGEIDLRPLKVESNLKLALPACINKQEVIYQPWRGSPLKEDYSGIPAPINERELNHEEIEILLVPALAVDQKGFRLGYGAGYFDRLRSIASWKNIPAFIIISEICITVDPLPKEFWDIPFNGWISEKGPHEI